MLQSCRLCSAQLLRFDLENYYNTQRLQAKPEHCASLHESFITLQSERNRIKIASCCCYETEQRAGENGWGEGGRGGQNKNAKDVIRFPVNRWLEVSDVQITVMHADLPTCKNCTCMGQAILIYIFTYDVQLFIQ